LLANGKKISYTMSLGFLAMVRITTNAGTPSQVGEKAATHGKRKPECVGKQKRCQYMIALLRICVSRTNEVEAPMSNWDPRFETSDRGLRRA
jgi:hypothetical protein